MQQGTRCRIMTRLRIGFSTDHVRHHLWRTSVIRLFVFGNTNNFGSTGGIRGGSSTIE